jgi:hypothetical protein
LHISLKSKNAYAPQHAHAQKITKRSGEDERSGEGDFGGLSDYDRHSTFTRTRKPSAAVRPSAAEKGGSGVSPDYNITQNVHAHNKPSAVEKRHTSDCNATQHAHATKREQW